MSGPIPQLALDRIEPLSKLRKLLKHGRQNVGRVLPGDLRGFAPNECAHPLPGDDHPILLEHPISTFHGVHGHAEMVSNVLMRREFRANRVGAVLDLVADCSCDLQVGRPQVVRIKFVHVRQLTRSAQLGRTGDNSSAVLPRSAEFSNVSLVAGIAELPRHAASGPGGVRGQAGAGIDNVGASDES